MSSKSLRTRQRSVGPKLDTSVSTLGRQSSNSKFSAYDSPSFDSENWPTPPLSVAGTPSKTAASPTMDFFSSLSINSPMAPRGVPTPVSFSGFPNSSTPMADGSAQEVSRPPLRTQHRSAPESTLVRAASMSAAGRNLFSSRSATTSRRSSIEMSGEESGRTLPMIMTRGRSNSVDLTTPDGERPKRLRVPSFELYRTSTRDSDTTSNSVSSDLGIFDDPLEDDDEDTDSLSPLRSQSSSSSFRLSSASGDLSTPSLSQAFGQSMSQSPNQSLSQSLSQSLTEPLSQTCLEETQVLESESSSLFSQSGDDDEGRPMLSESFNEDKGRMITAETLQKILTNQHEHSTYYSEVVIVDCRYKYEYEGGHIKNAININSEEVARETFFSSLTFDEGSRERTRKKLIVLHCEFSSIRAPTMFKFIRQMDRDENFKHNQSYGFNSLFYPEMYVLKGGYCNWYKGNDNTGLCEPNSYQPCLTVPDKKNGRMKRTASYCAPMPQQLML